VIVTISVTVPTFAFNNSAYAVASFGAGSAAGALADGAVVVSAAFVASAGLVVPPVSLLPQPARARLNPTAAAVTQVFVVPGRQALLLLDLSEEKFFERWHLAGDLRFPLGSLPEEVDELHQLIARQPLGDCRGLLFRPIAGQFSL
jgi:hypothetical protein